MDNRFFERPILNSPYEYPTRYWELDKHGQPTQQIVETRRQAEFITPIPKPPSGKRILICIGKQRVALDICCQATILNSPTAHASVAVIASAGSGDSRRKPKS